MSEHPSSARCFPVKCSLIISFSFSSGNVIQGRGFPIKLRYICFSKPKASWKSISGSGTGKDPWKHKVQPGPCVPQHSRNRGTNAQPLGPQRRGLPSPQFGWFSMQTHDPMQTMMSSLSGPPQFPWNRVTAGQRCEVMRKAGPHREPRANTYHCRSHLPLSTCAFFLIRHRETSQNDTLSLKTSAGFDPRNSPSQPLLAVTAWGEMG